MVKLLFIIFMIFQVSILKADNDVVIFDDAIINGQIVNASVSSDIAYEGVSSVHYYTDVSSGYTVFKFDILENAEIGSRQYLQMRVNFAPDATYTETKMRRIQLRSSSGTSLTYDPASLTERADYYIDGSPATIVSGRILFDDDINTWQLLTLDMTSGPGMLDTTQLRQINVIFHDAVNVYVDEVRVTDHLPDPNETKELVIFDENIITGSIGGDAWISSDYSYNGVNSVFLEGFSGTYTVMDFDLTGSVFIGNNHYLNMFVNFVPDVNHSDAKIRYISIESLSQTKEYKLDVVPKPVFYIDGVEVKSTTSRIIFDRDPSSWQLLTLDMSSGPGFIDPSNLRKVRVITYDPVNLYIDNVTVDSQSGFHYDAVFRSDSDADGQVSLDDLKTLSSNWMIDCVNGLFVNPNCLEK